MNIYEQHTLSNGIRVVHKQVPNVIAHLGVMVNAGSRDESEDEHGIAHFIEHVIFKGTVKRKAFQILSRLEDVGGEINAYTSKEETCVYASFMAQHYKKAIELLYDILFRSIFPEKEMKLEKEIILDEINSYKDSPAELIFDEFEELVFQDNPLGRSILGTKEKLDAFDKEKIRGFIQKNYNTDQIVITSVGNMPFGKLVRLVEQYFDDIPGNPRKHRRNIFVGYFPKNQEIDKNTHQVHCVLGNVAYGYSDPKRLGLFLLNNLLGGPGLSSRLNMTLREKSGFSYNSESSFTPYFDTGIFTVYFGTEKENLKKSISLVKKEFRKLRDKRLSQAQLLKAKQQLIGQIAISAENHETVMLNMGKSTLIYNTYDDFDTISQKIVAISSDELQRIANEVLDENRLSQLIYY